jgi:hypothetical protein
MHKSMLLLSSLIAVALSASAVRAADWQDTSLHYWYGSAFAEPGIGTVDRGTNIRKNVLSFTHASGYKYGGNFLNIDMLFSNAQDQKQERLNGATVGAGATEVYVVYRHNIGLNKLFASKPFEFGPVSDVNIAGGIDLNTKNTNFAPGKIMPIGGVEVSFAVPGFLNLGVMVDKELNSNGIVGKTVAFDPTVMFTAAWHIDIASLPLSFEGFGLLNLPKGKDGFGNDTVSELLLHPKLMYDVGTLFGRKGYQVGVGYQVWLNKFGNDHTKIPGCFEKAAFAEAAIHL